ncbi:hypothetical protein APHAL10511_004228 [Amanita phalloides]|nr:hypothetical protein APHAL10511_004228 [Amanita phalloides]
MQLPDLPSDVLRDIFSYCEPAKIAETCRTFANVIHSIDSLWTTIDLRPPQLIPEANVFLRSRLRRAGLMPLRVSIGPVMQSNDASTVSALCATLSEFNMQISTVEICAQTTLLASVIFGDIFPNASRAFLELKSLTILTGQDRTDGCGSCMPYLDKQLESIEDRFPALERLRIPTFNDCMPMPPFGASFSSLRSLILSGACHLESPNIVSVVAVLHCTPQLETLWFKHGTREDEGSIPADPGVPLDETKGRNDIYIPVTLSRLTHLAITVPGCALTLLQCIVAPVLQNLHLDGSRPPWFGLCCNPWLSYQSKAARNALRHLALNSPDLRHIALTSTFIEQQGWEWLLFGDSMLKPPPFPQLETVTLHDYETECGECVCGFDDALLVRLGNEPKIPLRRLVLSRCYLNFRSEAIVQALTAMTISDRVCELVYDDASLQFAEEDLEQLEIAGVRVIYQSKEEEDVEWFQDGPGVNIDPFDLYAY